MEREAKRAGRGAAVVAVGRAMLSVLLVWGTLAAQQDPPQDFEAYYDDYEYPACEACASCCGESGTTDVSLAPSEGVFGAEGDAPRDCMIEPSDGIGGFNNASPCLMPEEGPGGLDFDPSPTFRSLYKGKKEYPAGPGRLTGNNWFTRIPQVLPQGIGDMGVRFDADRFRVYTAAEPGTFEGRYLSQLSRLVLVDPDPEESVFRLYDAGGKTYEFEEEFDFRCTRITAPGGAQITFAYSLNAAGTGSIQVHQHRDATGTSRRRNFSYSVVTGRTTKIVVSENLAAPGQPENWRQYREIRFVYLEDLPPGDHEARPGDLIGVEDEAVLQFGADWLSSTRQTRRWVYKYYTTDPLNEPWDPANPGYRYQVRAYIGPESARRYLRDHPSPEDNIYLKTTAGLESLGNYVDRKYEYVEAHATLAKLELREACGCGSGGGTYFYYWEWNQGPLSDLNTWFSHLKVTLPDGSVRWLDYNRYGQTLHRVHEFNFGERQLVEKWKYNVLGTLWERRSTSACLSYDAAAKEVTESTTHGSLFYYFVDAQNVLTQVNLIQWGNPSLSLYQRTRTASMVPANWGTAGGAKRYQLDSESEYPVETTTGSGAVTTSYSYVYHSQDPLAVKKRTTTLPPIAAAENGSGQSVVLHDYFELDGLRTWHKDADGFVDYTGWDPDRRTRTQAVEDLNTGSPPVLNPPIPAPPDTDFQSGPGAHQNIVTQWEYDSLRRMTKETGPSFEAYLPSGVAQVQRVRQWHHTKFAGTAGEFVTLEYPHLGSSYLHVEVEISVSDHAGRVLTSAAGELAAGYQNTSIFDDYDPAATSLSAWWHGTITERTDFKYQGDLLVWQDAYSNAAAQTGAYRTEHLYDTAGMGRRVRTKNPVGTKTRWTYDGFGRERAVWVGTDDSGATDADPSGAGHPENDMTKVEEYFWDNEEADPRKDQNSRGSLTRVVRYTYDSGQNPRQHDFVHDYRARVVKVYEPLAVKRATTWTNRNQAATEEVYDITAGEASQDLLARTDHFYDAWRQPFETRTYGVEAGAANGYTSARQWRNSRGFVVKTLSRGKVFQKLQYDGAGRVTNDTVSYDLGELAMPAYSAADDLAGDTVLQEMRYVLDATGAAVLVRSYDRNHNGSGTGPLTVGPTGNSRAQYVAVWNDFLGRPTHEANYGTFGGVDMTARPAGNPPLASSSTVLLTQYDYSVGGTAVPRLDVEWVTDPRGLITQLEHDDLGRLVRQVEAYVDGAPGPASDEDRTTEYVYNGIDEVIFITAKASSNDQVTGYAYGVRKGVDNSLLSSNDILKTIQYPDPDSTPPGLPSQNADDQEVFGYNAQGELVWMRDQNGTEHVFEHDARSRPIHDRVTACNSAANPSLDCAVRRISRTYDGLDRLLKVASWDNAGVGIGTVLNEVQLSFGRYSAVTSVQQAWSGAVGSNPTRSVGYAWAYPTDGTTALRRLSTTYPSLKQITDVYSAGTDDVISRLSGRTYLGAWLFQERYLGLGRLVQRLYGTSGTYWTLIGPNPLSPSFDPQNNDYYFGLDRFGREDDLVLFNNSYLGTLNRYQYAYNFNSQVTVREDLVGNLYGLQVFDEEYTYDRVHRLTDRKRGSYQSGAMTLLQEHECFTMDRSGNRTQYYAGTSPTCCPAPAGCTWEANYNASNEITSWTILPSTIVLTAHDSAGNLTQKGDRTFVHDAWHRLVKVKSISQGTDLAVYRYNGLGQKIERTGLGAPSRHYYYSGDQVVEEWPLGGGSPSMDYVWGTQYVDDLVLRNLAAREFQFLDRQSSVMTRFNGPGSVTVVARHLYDAYGGPKQLSSNWQTFQTITEDLHLFTGRYWHKDHVQYDYRARWQDPQLGRFLERDPIGNWGANGSWGNAYLYADSDPGNLVDPNGRNPVVLTAWFALTFGGAVASWITAWYYSSECDACIDRARENYIWYVEDFCPRSCGRKTGAGAASAEYRKCLEDCGSKHEDHFAKQAQRCVDDMCGPAGRKALEGTAEAALGLCVPLVFKWTASIVNRLRGAATALASTADDLTAAAARARQAVGAGRGPVHGTRVHKAFEGEVDALGKPNLSTEVSYLDGQVVPRGTPGSVRVDVVEGPVTSPSGVFDLKTDGAKLTAPRIQQIQSHVPGGTSVPVTEIR
jgi:RHS repeat-associated protein